MMKPNVRPAGPGDAEQCLAILTRAFEKDPPCRWTWPGEQQFLDAFPVFARAFGGVAFETGNAWYSEGGVALWLAPGESPDEERLGQVMQETAAPERLESIFSLFEKMGSHHPEEPHWYLPLIGVEPTMQGRGIGAALMRPVLERCDREGLKAYLEASNPRNIPFYEKLGFKATGSIQVADSPCITPMIREPQGS